MKRKWESITVERKIVEVSEAIFKQRLEEVAEVFYDAFCELHRIRSVEPEKPKSGDELDQRKAG
jgi:hypothetical protein